MATEEDIARLAESALTEAGFTICPEVTQPQPFPLKSRDNISVSVPKGDKAHPADGERSPNAAITTASPALQAATAAERIYGRPPTPSARSSRTSLIGGKAKVEKVADVRKKNDAKQEAGPTFFIPAMFGHVFATITKKQPDRKGSSKKLVQEPPVESEVYIRSPHGFSSHRVSAAITSDSPIVHAALRAYLSQPWVTASLRSAGFLHSPPHTEEESDEIADLAAMAEQETCLVRSNPVPMLEALDPVWRAEDKVDHVVVDVITQLGNGAENVGAAPAPPAALMDAFGGTTLHEFISPEKECRAFVDLGLCMPAPKTIDSGIAKESERTPPTHIDSPKVRGTLLEMMAIERSFNGKLKLYQKGYVLRLTGGRVRPSVGSREFLRQIAPDMAELVAVSDQMLQQLGDLANEQGMSRFCDAFADILTSPNSVKAYSAYARRLAVAVARDPKTNPDFQEFITDCSTRLEESDGVPTSFSDLRFLPSQRPFQYKLGFENLMKLLPGDHQARPHVRGALDAVCSLLAVMEDYQKKAEEDQLPLAMDCVFKTGGTLAKAGTLFLFELRAQTLDNLVSSTPCEAVTLLLFSTCVLVAVRGPANPKQSTRRKRSPYEENYVYELQKMVLANLNEHDFIIGLKDIIDGTRAIRAENISRKNEFLRAARNAQIYLLTKPNKGPKSQTVQKPLAVYAQTWNGVDVYYNHLAGLTGGRLGSIGLIVCPAGSNVWDIVAKVKGSYHALGIVQYADDGRTWLHLAAPREFATAETPYTELSDYTAAEKCVAVGGVRRRVLEEGE
ncbi:uncharacterized protein EV422DRAFT_431110 [Fimicolochytrium jonesii]|uniref:uncharacterized protein n=1 Tax=Fimicolochytrium jonesii TaxID=1396493 RepID=UPI0022FEF9C6|nr:uncharacterized protein EV422DRAFT_431110 [Fimicolochytrium jonesii]KAI8821773.1 hypothetical protein EV422DRAFT_431110 [Fimicolochytrium jonesii]